MPESTQTLKQRKWGPPTFNNQVVGASIPPPAWWHNRVNPTPCTPVWCAGSALTTINGRLDCHRPGHWAIIARATQSKHDELRRIETSRIRPIIASRAGWALWLLAASFLLVFEPACGGDDESPVLVFAAASLVNAMPEIEREFESAHDGSLSISFGGSQALAQQIRRGAPADVFISAGTFQASELVDDGLVDGDEVDVLSNRLVLLVRPGVDMQSMKDLTGSSVNKIAIADPALAPAGRYAQESLTALDLWEDVQGRLIEGVDVRATMAYVESGNVDAAIVYKTDAAVADDAVVMDIVPPDSYSPVVYTAVLIKRPGRPRKAEDFIEFLTSETAATVFEKSGFDPVGR